MSETYIAAELRRLVRARANACCEYCGIAEEETWFGCEVDHVISEKHGGRTEPENLALACVTCNRAKGSDIASVTEEGARLDFSIRAATCGRSTLAGTGCGSSDAVPPGA